MSLVHHSIYSSTADATSHSVALTASPVAGRTIIMAASTSVNAGLVTPSGWTLITQDSGPNAAAFYKKVADGTETAITFGLTSAGDLIAHVLEWDDVGTHISADFHFSNNGTVATGSTFGASLDPDDYYAVGYIENNTPVAGKMDTWRAPQSLVGSVILGAGSGLKHMSSLGIGDGTGGTDMTMQVGPTDFAGNNVCFVQLHIAKQASPLTVDVGGDFSSYNHAPAAVAASTTGGSGAKTYAWSKVSGGTGSFADSAAQSTTFTPSSTGDYVLRCTVTDTSGSAHDDLTVHVTNAPALVSYAAIAASTGWSPTPGDQSVLQVLADALDTSYITSSDTPSNVIVDGTLGALTQPAPDADFTVRVRMQKISATTGSLEAKLYVATTLVSTVTVGIPSTLSDVNVVFPAADLASVTEAQWAAGLRLTLGATAA